MNFIENPAAPIMSLEKVREAYAAQHAYDLKHPVKGMITTIIFTSGTTGKPKGCKFRTITCSALLTGWLWTRNLQRQSVRKCWRNRPIPLTLCHVLGTDLALEEPFFALPSAITQDFKQLFATIFSFRLLSDQRTSFADMAMLSEDFNAEKMPGITHFYFDGEELTVKLLKIARAFPNARINEYGQQKQL